MYVNKEVDQFSKIYQYIANDFWYVLYHHNRIKLLYNIDGKPCSNTKSFKFQFKIPMPVIHIQLNILGIQYFMYFLQKYQIHTIK